MRKILILFLLVISLFVAFVIPASAAVYDPFENGSVSIVGDQVVVSINSPDDIFWRRVHDGDYRQSGTGSSFSYQTQMRYVDNDLIHFYLFGNGGMVSTDGFPTDSTITLHLHLETSVDNVTQDYTEDLSFAWYGFDANGQNPAYGGSLKSTSWTTTGQGYRQYDVEWTLNTSALLKYSYFRIQGLIEWSGVANENDTTSVSVFCGSQSMNLIIPYSQLYQLSQQGEKTNKLLDQIDKQMAANGEKLDDVIKESQNNAEKLDDVIQGNEQIHDDIDNAVNGTIPPAHVPAGNDKIDDLDNQEGQLRDDAADGLQQGLDMMDDTLDALFTYSFGFFALGMVFELFFQIPFFNVLVSLALVLGILASFLGILVDISGQDHSPSGRFGKYSRRKPGGKYTKSAVRARAKVRSKGGKS